MKQYVTRG